MKLKILFLIIVLNSISFAQLDYQISSNKMYYNYGEVILLEAEIKNISDSTVQLMAPTYQTCQAEFYFNDFYSGEFEACLATVEVFELSPDQSRIYKWRLDPKVLGLPNRNGTQTIVGTYFNGLEDTITIEAPIYLGGQINVVFTPELSASIDSLKDTLNITVLESDNYLNEFHEVWQMEGYPLDSVYAVYKNDKRFYNFEPNRAIGYSGLITGLEDIKTPDEFKLSQNYPNPFNPSTVIRYSVPRQVGQAAVDAPSSVEGLQQVSLKVFDVLGNEITTLVKDYQRAGNYEVTFNGAGLASGIYFYKISVGNFHQTKKMILMK